MTRVAPRAPGGRRAGRRGRPASGQREMSLEGNGRTLLVGNFEPGQLEAVNVAALP